MDPSIIAQIGPAEDVPNDPGWVSFVDIINFTDYYLRLSIEIISRSIIYRFSEHWFLYSLYVPF